ncbi:MAG: cyclic lactone autoinducer peptide [Defluviitaleaceae bacterium]|nr:cyclic lactone autoinducer peptide [Defluviitaleaceae bacterium]
MKRTIKNKVVNLVAKATTAVAKSSANTTCGFGIHQPKLPEKVKKLRKF